jgi:hypothetical protein
MFWRKKKSKCWQPQFNPAWYSTGELQAFHQELLERISHAAKPVHELVQEAARLETEIHRRIDKFENENL